MKKDKLLTAVLAAICIITIIIFAKTDKVSGDVNETYIVAGGETLWDIASGYAGDSYDVREVIYDIQKASGIDEAIIHPGDKLIIPGKYLR